MVTLRAGDINFTANLYSLSWCIEDFFYYFEVSTSDCFWLLDFAGSKHSIH